VKLTFRLPAGAAALAIGLITALGASGPALAAGPQLQIPDFSHLRDKAVETVDVTLDGFLLRVAKKFALQDGHSDEALTILQDIDSLRVRSFDFDHEDAYSSSDVEAVRRQLSGPGWSALAQVHRRDPKSDVDVFLNTDGSQVLGLAVVASEPRSFTIVNIVGRIDLDKLAKLEGQFGIPRVQTAE
jgi:hypothetical protein